MSKFFKNIYNKFIKKYLDKIDKDTIKDFKIGTEYFMKFIAYFLIIFIIASFGVFACYICHNLILKIILGVIFSVMSISMIVLCILLIGCDINLYGMECEYKGFMSAYAEIVEHLNDNNSERGSKI